MHATVVGSACAGLELDAGSGHKVTSSNVCSFGDTRKSFSEKRMMSPSCTLTTCAKQHIREARGC